MHTAQLSSGDKMEAQNIGFQLSGSFHFEHSFEKTELFNKLKLEVKASQWTCLLGPSGVGKTTLLRLLAGLPTEGHFEGEITATNNIDVAQQVCYMAQSDLLFPWLDVLQNVTLGQSLRRTDTNKKSNDELAMVLIERVGLTKHCHKRPHQLSGGMRQRVALARTLMEDKPLVLLDEPFSALDAATRSKMQDLSFELLQHKTVLLVTHDPGEAVRLAHHLFVMSVDAIDIQSLPNTPPLRAIDDGETMKAQAKLLAALKS